MKLQQEEHSVLNRVREALLDEIRKMEIGTRLLPERQLAEQFGVCKMTMNKIMKSLVDDGYLSRHVGRGTYVLPRPQPVAQVAFNGTSRGEIIIVYPDFYSHGILERVRLTELAAMRANLRLINIKIHPEVNLGPVYELVEACRNLRGMIVVAGPPLNGEAARLDAIGCPVVMLGELPDAGVFRNLFVISNNHFQSGFLKMNALLEKGHRKLGWIPNEPRTLAGRRSLRGIKQALYKYKLRYQNLVRPVKQIRFWESPMQAGYEQTKEVMQAHPELTALVIDTIPGALGALRAFAELGIRCPEDVSLVTAYDMFGYEEFTFPRLTRVVEPCEQIVAAAMRIIQSGGVSEPREIMIDLILKEGESIRQL